MLDRNRNGPRIARWARTQLALFVRGKITLHIRREMGDILTHEINNNSNCNEDIIFRLLRDNVATNYFKYLHVHRNPSLKHLIDS